MSSRRGKLKIAALAVALFVSAAICEVAMTPVGVAEGYMVRSEGNQPSSEAVTHALGEFRIVAANLIWLNVVDRYHHEFMEQGGSWEKNVALLPYLRMLVLLDPHFIEAYDTASNILAATGHISEGEQFLKEGISHNPKNAQLYYDMAIMEAWFRNDAKAALPYALAAEKYADDESSKRLHIMVRTLEDDIRTGTLPVKWRPAPKK
ncbi:MAG TPA: hypothetical protein VGK19_00120 [Capsulimonadaceae bacterium]|jgi:hypothetical protein